MKGNRIIVAAAIIFSIAVGFVVIGCDKKESMKCEYSPDLQSQFNPARKPLVGNEVYVCESATQQEFSRCKQNTRTECEAVKCREKFEEAIERCDW